MRTEPDVSANVTPNQRRAILLLATGHSGTETAKLVGVTRQTVSEWQSVPKFRTQLDTLTQEAAQWARQELRNLTLEATQVVRSLLKNGTCESVRLRAALAVLDLTGVGRTSGFQEPVFDPTGKDLGAVLDEIEREGRHVDEGSQSTTHRPH